MTSSMSWYPLPQIEGTMSAGDEFFESQSFGWIISAYDDQYTAALKQEPCSPSTGPSEEEQSEGPAPFEDLWFTQPTPTEDIFLSQFSDEEMRRMDDAPFEALDMFPDSMHRLQSYENMLTGVLTGSDEEGGDATLLDRNGGVCTMDTCGFPLFSHDLQNGSRNAGQSSNPEMLAGPSSEPEEDKQAGLSRTKRSRPVVTDTEDTPAGFEALVLEELEGVVFQLTKRTRICYRDAFYRLAESSRANCSAAKATEVGSSASRQSFHQQPGGDASRRFSTPGCPERETNPIDRTVMVLTMKPPRQLHGTCSAGGSGAEAARSATSWTTSAGVGGSTT